MTFPSIARNDDHSRRADMMLAASSPQNEGIQDPEIARSAAAAPMTTAISASEGMRGEEEGMRSPAIVVTSRSERYATGVRTATGARASPGAASPGRWPVARRA